MAQEITITAETTAADIAKLAAQWAYQSGGVPTWLITRLLFAERRIAELNHRVEALEKAAAPPHLRKQEKR